MKGTMRVVSCPANPDMVHRVYHDPEGGDRCEDCNLLSKYCEDKREVSSPWP